MPARSTEAPMQAHEARAARSPWRVPGELGVEEWFELNAQADDGSRYELIDGSLIVSPAPLPMHQWIGDNLRAALQEAAPRDLVVITATGLLLDGRPGVIPDVMAVERQPIREGASVVRPEWVRLVVEIVSRSTTMTDRVVKPAKYAEAGIPCFWRVETHPFRGQAADRLPVVLTHRLDENGQYQLTHRVGAGEAVAVAEPFKVTVDPEALARV
ncbi:Uma2 family endonuclease [Microbispora sp. NPDC046933]|uniref:Uma2 family endonuclease n=1 Tax=Microbispora sp. NPDC046933 TaxID=3155618 RepID=UPI00341101F1